MSYTKLFGYSVIPVAILVLGIAIANLVCMTIGIIAEVGVLGFFFGVRRKETEERALHAPREGEATRRSA